MKKKQYITKSELSQRWSNTLINKFFDSPSMTKKNAYGGLTCLYSIKEVEKIEKRKEFKEAMEKTSARKAKRQNVEKELKSKKIQSFIDNIQFDLGDTSTLIDRAIEHYNDNVDYYNMTHDIPKYHVSKDNDKKFLDRITCNYVRHMCSNYDELLEQEYYGKYKNDAYFNIKDYISDTLKMLGVL